VHDDDTFVGCQVDHIISEKHGGATVLENLALACATCNRAKGSDVGSVVTGTGSFVRFFNPRIDRWSDHFTLRAVEIVPLTAIGQVTERILQMNSIDRLLERGELEAAGRYPSATAIARLGKG
jgi:hypothetical protein